MMNMTWKPWDHDKAKSVIKNEVRSLALDQTSNLGFNNGAFKRATQQ